jgi:hypothetical protein
MMVLQSTEKYGRVGIGEMQISEQAPCGISDI